MVQTINVNEPEFQDKIRNTLLWAPAYFWQRWVRRLPAVGPLHLLIGVADHFEPMNRSQDPCRPVDRDEQERRVRDWCNEYPDAIDEWRDHDGRPFVHTYFYPAEEYDAGILDILAEHCHTGWGEIEIHLHHGIEAPDTKENTHRTLTCLRDALAERGCLSQMDGVGGPRYGFVHGNWALANSDHGRFCGVDEEIQVLADTGCYADFTLPAPTSAQISKINSVYECVGPLDQRAPHRRGVDLRAGRLPVKFPLILQGPLMMDLWRTRSGSYSPGIENSELSRINPPTMRRLQLWRNAAIRVDGRPDWLFIKLHCHGLQSGDREAMLGAPAQMFLGDLLKASENGKKYRVHFVTMREMVNIALAACDCRQGEPSDFRDYRLKLLHAQVHK